MLPTIVHIPYEVATPWGAVPLFGMGLLLAIWVCFSIALLGWLVVRHGWTSEVLGQLPVLLLIAAGLLFVMPQLVEYDAHHRPIGVPIRGYGVMLLLAIVSGVGLAVWRAQRVGISSEVIHSLAMWMFLAGFAGARLFFVIEYWHEFQKPTLSETLVALANIAQGGLVVYGSVIGAALAFVVFTRRKRLPMLKLADVISPSLVLGLALGRIGCFLNGCCFGGPTLVPWGVEFPPGSPPFLRQMERGQLYGVQLSGVRGGSRGSRIVPIVSAIGAKPLDGSQEIAVGDQVMLINRASVRTLAEAEQAVARAFQQKERLSITVGDPVLGKSSYRTATFDPLPGADVGSLPVHPTQLYSTINALILLGLLLAYDPFRRRDGELAALLFTLYPITRFLIEAIRVDEPPISGTGLSISQNISLLVLTAVVCGWVYLLRQPAVRPGGPAGT